MRHELSGVLPIVQDELHENLPLSANFKPRTNFVTNGVSSNMYYGYQSIAIARNNQSSESAKGTVVSNHFEMDCGNEKDSSRKRKSDCKLHEPSSKRACAR